MPFIKNYHLLSPCPLSAVSYNIFFAGVTIFALYRIICVQGNQSEAPHTVMTEKEYNKCVNQYADNVYRFIVKNLRHEEDARDIVQTAFEKLWRNRDQVESAKSKSYLFTVAYNQMIDHIRKVKRIQLKEEFEEDGRSQHQGSSNMKKILMEAVNRLNETQKSLVMLKDYEGYSYEEIGEIMNLSESQVKVYLHRARQTLRTYLVSPENVR